MHTLGLTMVEAGHAVFPCEGKRPFKGWKWGDVTIRSPNDPQNGALLHSHPEWGWPVPPGLVVIDVDHPEKLPPELAELCCQPNAGQVTPNGFHIVLKGNAQGPAQVHHDWGEVRKHGTYMRLYEPNSDWVRHQFCSAPAWVLELFQKTRATVPPHTVAPDAGEELPKARSQGLRLVSTSDPTTEAQEGSRNNTMTAYLGLMANQPGMTAQQLLALATSKNATYSPPLDHEELHTIWQSACRWLPERALIQGPSRPGESCEPPPVGSQTTGGQEVPTSCPRMTLEELQTADIPPIHFWWGPYGPGQAVILYGYTGHGKSILMFDHMRRLVAQGNRVVIVDGELPWPQLKKRAGRYASPAMSYMKPETMADWYEYDYSQDDVIVLDTKAALYSDKASENEAEHWARLHTFVKYWVARGKCVVLVHHSGKSDDLRGSSNAAACFDTTIHIKREEQDGEPTGTYKVRYMKDRHYLNEPVAQVLFETDHQGVVSVVKL